MGIFSRNNRVKSQSSTTTLIAEGCTINGHIKVESRLQIDGQVEGQVEAMDQIKISESGYVIGDIITERLIINGNFEGTCHAKYIEILNCGRVNGTVYSDNLSIEPGGKFMGITNPSDEVLLEQNTSEHKVTSGHKMISEQEEDHDLAENMALLSKNSRP